MRRPLFATTLLALAVLAPPAARAQALADTVIAWQGYGQTSRCRVVIYPAGEGGASETRTRTIIVREMADNRGPSTLDDARFLVEQIGRSLGVEPASAYWVFHWGGFSFESTAEAQPGKEIFLRATFRATDRGRLTPPSWRVVSRADIDEITDRRYRG